MKKKVLLVFPDGTGVRNYFYSNAFSADVDLTLFHNFSEESIDYLQSHRPFRSAISIPKYSESVLERFLRELICLCRLRHNAKQVNNPTILNFWQPKQNKMSLKVLYRSVEIASFLFNKYSHILKLEKQYQSVIRRNPLYKEVAKILIAEKPDLIFCTHQRGLKMPVIFAAANDLEIATTSVIYSWDNIPKARLALRANKYLVWSDYMKRELQTYYPEILAEQIAVTGTPQFEFYSDPEYIIDKAVFYERYKLDIGKKIICFSGDDVRTSPDDPKYLEDLASGIIDSGLDNQFQILFRRAPVDVSGRYDAVVARYPELIRASPPLWVGSKKTDWQALFPSVDDVSLLVSTAYYSDVVMNIGSTMAFDFSIFEKPCIFINYDQEIQLNKKWSVKTIYNFQHFRSMPERNAVFWLNSKKEIADTLIRATTSKNFRSIHKWSAIILGNYTDASTKIQQTISNL